MSTQNDIFLARQPIFDRQRKVAAYELLFREDQSGEARVTDDARATAQVIARAFGRLGLNSVIGGSTGFVNVDAEMLMSGRIEKLPRERVVLELLETIEIDCAVLERCAELKHLGYRLALDDVCAVSREMEPLLDIVDVVKLDILQVDPAALEQLVRRLRLHPAKLLAEKVDTLERARRCLALGFDLFQGYLFARPTLLAA
ncbi:EAL domain-containing protein [Aromatoleum toluvorans]|uniref:EAL domain-containing protein n=1 Tax=Aromatoleum toluvorans TaxID=92002 RepID=A0ABX1Q2G8_9RHOO|nr:EAL domain-containing protein [Aromatoleum toluvorans]NMG44936.1 EAL domain-containing protein [Aromatoleum toluvorans]